MGKVIVLAAVLSGCVTFGGGDDTEPGTPDAAVSVDAATCQEGLPRCVQRDPLCATGQVPVDCPRAEDKSVCFCPSQTNPGWCFNH